MLFADVGTDIPDRRQSVLVVTTATFVITTIFIAARLVSRLVIVRKITWDDYFIVLGWVSVSLADARMVRSSKTPALTVLEAIANRRLVSFLRLV